MTEPPAPADLTPPIEYLTLEDVVALAAELHGDPPPIRDLGLLGSAVARPATTVFGEDAYPDLLTKAAALLHSLVGNYALVDGNERLAWTATATFLAINGRLPTNLDEDAAFDLLIHVATGGDDLEVIAERLADLFPGQI